MRADVLTREYPPDVYGGAGVHVAELVRAMRALNDMDVRVHCWGSPRDEAGTTAYEVPASIAGPLRRPRPMQQGELRDGDL